MTNSTSALPPSIQTPRQIRDFYTFARGIEQDCNNIPDVMMGNGFHKTRPDEAKGARHAFLLALERSRDAVRTTNINLQLWGSTILTAGGIYYHNGYAQMGSKIWGLDGAIPILLTATVGAMATTLIRSRQNIKTYTAIEQSYRSQHQESFDRLLIHMSDRLSALKGTSLPELLVALPRAENPALPRERYLALGRTLLNDSEQRARVTNENPATLFTALSQRHCRNLALLAGSTLVTLAGTSGQFLLQQNWACAGIATIFGLVTYGVGREALQTYRIFDFIGCSHRRLGHDRFAALVQPH